MVFLLILLTSCDRGVANCPGRHSKRPGVSDAPIGFPYRGRRAL